MMDCDAYSKWVDIQLLKNLTADSTINALRRIFKYVGLPRSIVTDNGGNFISEELSTFLKNNFVTHIFTPPGHHSSNGLVERMIQTFKNYIRKQEADSMERMVNSFCLYINTTFTVSGAIPADFVFLQTPRTRLSVVCTEFKPVESKVPAIIRIENKPPVPSAVARPCGTNTYVDERDRLVHRADITRDKSACPENQVPSEENAKKPEEVSLEDSDREVCSSAEHPVLRRSTRTRVEPDRLRYT